MNVPAENLPMIPVPSSADAADRVREMQRLFARTLSCWAVDVLRLRHSGAIHPVWNAPAEFKSYRKAA